MGNLGFLDGYNLGNHIVQFYHQKEDLFEAVVPFFQQGLSGGEYCLWLVPGLISMKTAWSALRGRIPDIAEFRDRRQFEIADAEKWYGGKGIEALMTQLERKLQRSQKRGFARFRIAGGLYEIPKSRLGMFLEYEKRAHTVLASAPGMAICTYSLETVPVRHMEKVIGCHHQAFMRKGWNWQVLHST